jgi:hypothetical protein
VRGRSGVRTVMDELLNVLTLIVGWTLLPIVVVAEWVCEQGERWLRWRLRRINRE